MHACLLARSLTCCRCSSPVDFCCLLEREVAAGVRVLTQALLARQGLLRNRLPVRIPTAAANSVQGTRQQEQCEQELGL